MKRYELPVLLAIFLDLIGFGMAFPDIQLRAQALGASGLVIGLLLASLFAVQFIVSPKWGALSDRVGRKPIVVACTVLSALSMLVYATTNSLWGILFSRILGGLAAANVVVAQAYLADNTDESERATVMGRISAAISIGLIVGPFLGGQLVEIGGSRLMGLTAAAASGFGALTLLVGMKHDRPKETREPGKAPIIDLRLLRDLPDLRPMFILAAVAWFALACLEGTFGRLLAVRYSFPLTELGMTFTKPQGASGAIFGMESLISFAIQGLLFGWLSRRVGDRTLLRLGYVCQGVGLLLTPFAPFLGLLFAFSAIYSVGGALTGPTVNTICSNLTPEKRQGELFGLLQAARSLGFLVGPMLGGVLFDWSPAAPYVLAGGVATFAALLVPVKALALAKKEA